MEIKIFFIIFPYFVDKTIIMQPPATTILWGFNAVYIGEARTFRRNMLPPSSRSKSTPNKQPATIC
jgi:hypothetical protein